MTTTALGIYISVFAVAAGILRRGEIEGGLIISFLALVISMFAFVMRMGPIPPITENGIFTKGDETPTIEKNITDNENFIVEDKDSNKYLIVYNDNGKPIIV